MKQSIRSVIMATLFVLLGALLLLAPAQSYGAARAPLLVVVDAGHGGKDPGATGFDGLREKQITLSIAQLLQILAWDDPEVRIVLTRHSDRFISLRERIALANHLGAALYVSIHANAFPRSSRVRGTETLVAQSDSRSGRLARGDRVLAQSLQHQLQVKLGNYGLTDRGVHEQRLYLRWAQMPAALVETGFITNPAEAQKLDTFWYQLKIAKALLDGIKAYLLDSGAQAG
ncbi:MAG TPA: N-acetylmuramoyl-L-alanine amidase [Candidatus Fraserbacteria bacterium]|nr:N-acetylmuramoyl-L-alanine amidase [Candidatus Fraserbacteria bacterium]